MFRLGKVSDLEPLFLLPELDFMRYSFTPPTWSASTLKVLGNTFVYKMILDVKPNRLLEFGHGIYSPFFDLFCDRYEIWGIEKASDSFNEEQLNLFRSNYACKSNIKFLSGYLEIDNEEIPDDYFDCVFSVSVLEHVPFEALQNTFRKIYKALKPGGYSLHSYDFCQSLPELIVEEIYHAHKLAGLEFMDQACTPKLDWNSPDVCLEDPRIVLNWYMYQVKDNEKMANWPGHYRSILMAARKPVENSRTHRKTDFISKIFQGR